MSCSERKKSLSKWVHLIAHSIPDGSSYDSSYAYSNRGKIKVLSSMPFFLSVPRLDTGQPVREAYFFEMLLFYSTYEDLHFYK